MLLLLVLLLLLLLVVMVVVLLLVLLVLLLLLLLLLLLVVVVADEAFGLLTLPPAGGRGNKEDVERGEGDAWKDVIEGRDKVTALQRPTARRSDLRVCVPVSLVSGGRGLLLRAQDGPLLEASMVGPALHSGGVIRRCGV